MKKNKELRFSTGPLEFRDGDDGEVTVVGYAAVFDEETEIGSYFREVIRPGAFKNALERGDDVVFLINHDGLPLARSSSGTLKLTEDKRGLLMETSLDTSDPDVARIVPKMRRGDLNKMSFAFRPDEETWVDREEDEMPLREVLDVRLYDVAIVTTPAYGGTEIGLRTFEQYQRTQSESCNKKRRRRMKMKTELAAR
jgi:HK97 family phage prohead protease